MEIQLLEQTLCAGPNSKAYSVIKVREPSHGYIVYNDKFKNIYNIEIKGNSGIEVEYDEHMIRIDATHSRNRSYPLYIELDYNI